MKKVIEEMKKHKKIMIGVGNRYSDRRLVYDH